MSSESKICTFMSPTHVCLSCMSILTRPSQHFEGLTKLKESGAFKMGGNTALPLSLELALEARS